MLGYAHLCVEPMLKGIPPGVEFPN